MQRALADYAEAHKQSWQFIAVKGGFGRECKYFFMRGEVLFRRLSAAFRDLLQEVSGKRKDACKSACKGYFFLSRKLL